MGWWIIDSVETGGIGCPTLLDDEKKFLGGDPPADIMGAALKKIDGEFMERWGRHAKGDELLAVFNFCCNGLMKQRKEDEQHKVAFHGLTGQ